MRRITLTSDDAAYVRKTPNDNSSAIYPDFDMGSDDVATGRLQLFFEHYLARFLCRSELAPIL